MKLTILLMLTLSSLSFASGDKFETRKAKRIKMLDSTIANLNKTKSCYQAASDMDGLKACGKERKAMREAIKAKRKIKKASQE